MKLVEVTASSGMHGGTVAAVAYCCRSCDWVLGVESHPLERDAQITNLVKQCVESAKLMDETSRRIKGMSLMFSEWLKKSEPPPPPPPDPRTN